MRVYCDECGKPLTYMGSVVPSPLLCASCFFDLTGEDRERDEKEARTEP